MKDEQTPGGDKLDQWIEQITHDTTHEPKASVHTNQSPAKPGHQAAGQAQAKPGQQQNQAPTNRPVQANANSAKPPHTPHHPPHHGKFPPRNTYGAKRSMPTNQSSRSEHIVTGAQKLNVPPKVHKGPHNGPPHAAPHVASPPKKKFLGLFGGRPAPNPAHKPAPFTRNAPTVANIPATNIINQPLPRQHHTGKLRCIMVGGLDEVGKNCMILEYGNDIILIDLGFQFPEEDMLGVDYVIPDLSYLDDKIDRMKAIIITHGHLDHVGAIPYVLPKLKFPPIYATKLTNALIGKRLEEFGLLQQTKLLNVTKDDVIQLGNFNVSFFHVNHSIPDAVGVVVKTPAGNIVHTGDFKFDFTPAGDQAPPDFARLAGLANENIAALFIDSTNALKSGYSISEKKVGESLEHIIKNTDGRILITSFSSQIGRIQQIINYAKKHGRTIYTSGRSLSDNIFIATKLGYLKLPAGIVQDIRKMGKVPENKVIILTTGSQGEPTSALTRMALEDHPKVKVKKGDTIVFSSSQIPGNERAITSVTNNLCKLGAHIVNNQIMDVHAGGHAQKEDLKLMMNLVKAKNIVPVHGEYYMRYGNKEIALSIGYNDKNTVLVENGAVLEIENGELKVANETVENKYILVDGLGVGDIGAQVMMDRQTLAENGVLILVVSIDPNTRKIKKDVDVISRGFIYMQESEELVKAISQMARDAYTRVVDKRGGETKRGDIKKYIKETVDKFVHQQLERHPLVLPIIIEQ